MLDKKILEALNEQLNKELYSAYLYFSMAAYFESLNLKGFANWMKVQSQEEITHATKFFDYINAKGEKVRVMAISQPPTDWDSPLDVFEAAYKHEQNVTKMINNIADMAVKENDHATYNMLQWFVTEQVEEEASVSEIKDKLSLIGKDGRGILMIDRELGERKFVTEM